MKLVKLLYMLVTIGMLAAVAEAALSDVSLLPLPTSLVFLVAGLAGLVLTRLWAD